MNTRELLQDQLALLERAHATRFEDDEEWWVWFVTKKLGLPLPYERAVRKAVDETPWRSKKSPIGYVKRAAKYMARDELGLADPDDGVFKVVAVEIAAASLVKRKRSGRVEDSDEALERIVHAYWDSQPEDGPDSVDPIRGKSAYWAGSFLSELGLGERDPLRDYIVDRMFGLKATRKPTEATRKRFQRLRGEMQKILRRYAQDEAWLDKE